MKAYWVAACSACCAMSQTSLAIAEEPAAAALHPQAAAETAQPAWVFDVRGGLGLAVLGVWSSTELYEPLTWGGPALSLGASGRWVIPAGARRWSVGPDLGAAFFVSIFDAVAYPFFVDLDLVFMFEAFTEPRLRGFLSAGAGPSWNNTRNTPRSFDVQRELGSAFGFHGFLGYGLERRLTRGRSFTLETRLELRNGYTHEHEMTQLATGAVARSRDHVAALTAGVTFGFRFWR